MSKSSKQISREELARREVGRTSISAANAWLLILVFIAVVGCVPAVQFVHDISAYRTGARASVWPQSFEIFREVPAAASAAAADAEGCVARLLRFNANLMAAFERYETGLENESVVAGAIRRPVQYVLSACLGAGNEKAYIGRKHWLFYRPGIDYVIGPGFLEPERMERLRNSGSEWQAAPHPDAFAGIADFARQLRERGIELVVMPTPVKPVVHPEMFWPGVDRSSRPLHNVSYDRFVDRLEERGIRVFDCSELLVERVEGAGQPQYLAGDTHWTPDAVEAVAAALADYLLQEFEWETRSVPMLTTRRDEVTATGDILAMLQLPEWQKAFPDETVVLRQISIGNGPWRADTAADILLLGDSFSNIYSLEAMGWGDSAGFCEQLSFELKRPIDRIVRNDDGAYATREALARELARGRDRLAGKRVVVYQFAERELSVGDWKPVPLEFYEAAPSHFYVPERGATVRARGVVAAVSPVPRPGSVPYRDHVMSVHLVDLHAAATGLTNGEAVVYLASMKDHVWTKAARLRPGDTVELTLKSWSDVAGTYEGLNRSELDDLDLQLQPPCWGQW